MRPLVDSYGRTVRSVRVSLTDRCNFRCVYCTPADGFDVSPSSQYLTVDEVVRLVRILERCGVDRVRLTGGEPLLRRDIVEVVRALRDMSQSLELSMTTNASRLAPVAADLREAGLDRVNVSLDSLDPERFEALARADQYQRVFEGIDAALRAGFATKVNVVVMRGITDEEIRAFAELAVRLGVEVRFLEFMPLCGDGWSDSRVYPIGEVRALLSRHYRLRERPRGDRTAQTFDIDGTRGRLGFIGSLTEPFCTACSRIRVSARGSIRPCLFSSYEVDVRSALRDGAGDGEIERAVREAVSNKPAGSQFSSRPFREGDGRTHDGGPFIRSVGG